MKGYQMLKHCCGCLICCLLLLPQLACLNGPIRYKTVGYRKYISINPEHKWMIMALPADVVISATDFVAIPVVAIPVTLSKGGPDGRGLLPPGTALSLSPCGIRLQSMHTTLTDLISIAKPWAPKHAK